MSFIRKHKIRPAGVHRQREERIVVAADGLESWQAVRGFYQQCRKALSASPVELVLDLSKVEHADSKLIAALVLLARRAKSAGTTLRVRTSSVVAKWISLCRLDQILSCTTTE